MSNWEQDIASWASRNNRDPDTVEGILLSKGWKPKKYQASMKEDLFYYLDQWYTLAVKKLPKPATNLRKNPDPDLRKLERAAVSGLRDDVLKYAHALGRVGREEDAQIVRDSLFVPIEIYLNKIFDTPAIPAIHDMTAERTSGDVDAIISGSPEFDVTLNEIITPQEFVEEWIMAEEGSWEDHGSPEAGHVYNYLKREPLDILSIREASELRELLYSLGSNTAGLTYEIADGNWVFYRNIYGQMVEKVLRVLKRKLEEFVKSIT